MRDSHTFWQDVVFTFYALQTCRKHFYHYKQGKEILLFEKLFQLNQSGFREVWKNHKLTVARKPLNFILFSVSPEFLIDQKRFLPDLS